MTNIDFTAAIRAWLREHPDDRDLQYGAQLLLRIDRNQVFYRAALANPGRYMPAIEEKLKEHLRRRLARPSPEQVEKLVAEASEIVYPSSVIKKIKGGRRPDHDSLPEEIRSLYAENLELRHKMQQYHLQIRMLRASKADCAPEDIRDLVTLLRNADVKYLKNWKAYDEYGKQL